ncbi:MAG: NAD-dependent epimerase/dehydratase family protein [Nitrosopumilaceae archaeon]
MKQEIEKVASMQKSPYSIMVTGATGFIGSRLLDSLVKRGYSVKGMSRKEIGDRPQIKFVKTDVFDLEELTNSLRGIETAYYLLHSMEGSKEKWKDFAAREKIQAENFLNAATKAGVKRIIYLGGLVNTDHELSPHMKSRKEVGEILSSGRIPVTELRASLIIGAEGGSYAMLRYLVERLRFMVCPSWVKSLAQPIAVDDVVEYLVGCMEHEETSGKIYDIGGPDKMTYEELMRVYSAYLNKNLFILQIPFLTTRLSSYWVDLITPVKASLARPLIDSLVHDTVVQNDEIQKIIPLHLKSVRDAIDIATKEIQKNPPNHNKKEEKTGFKINQKILMVSLFAYAICGSTYYWLDNRPDVYEPLWLLASGIWYVAIGFSILFVYNKTRLGYLMAGVLTWVTMAFWLFDNFHVVFQMSLIATQPSEAVIIRNFVGIAITVVAIIASHNLFHKVIDYQYKGKPI